MRSSVRIEEERAPQKRQPPPSLAPALPAAAAEVLALQQTAGNAAVSGMLARQAPVADPPEFVGPLRPVDPVIDAAWTAELRRQAGSRVDKAFTKYVSACDRVRGELAAKEAEPSLAEQLVLMAFGALLPGMAGVILDHVRGGLVEFAKGLIETYLKNHPQARGSDDAQDLADTYIALDSEKAQTGLTNLMETVPKPEPDGPAGEPMPVGDLLDAFVLSFDDATDGVQQRLGTLDRAGVLGVWATYAADNTTVAFYMAQIRDLVAKHEKLGKAGAEGAEGGGYGGMDYQKIVMLNAWGVVQPAIIDFKPSAAPLLSGRRTHYAFREWVALEMRAVAIAAGKAQTGGMWTIGPDTPVGHTGIRLQGHIDDPKSEGDRVVEIVVGSKPRLARVDVVGAGGEFKSWVAPSDERFARVQGEAQPGGIVRMDASKIEDVPPVPPGG